MKKVSMVLALLMACALLAAGCQNSAASELQAEEEKQPEAVVIEDETDDTEEPDDAAEEPAAEETPAEEPSAQTEAVVIYSSNENADGFVTEEVETSELTAQWLLDQLAARGVISADVQALSCRETDVDGVKSLDLDLNQAFATFMQSSGSTGEYISLGSLCNTFLDAYGCEQIRITVEGGTLSTGHTDYAGYMGRFE